MKKKVISLTLAFIMCLMSLSMVFATDWKDNFKPENQGSISVLGGTVNNVLGAIQTLGYVVAIIMVMYVGIKYLTAGATKKAEAKETLIPILVGAILIVAATTITSWLFSIAGEATASKKDAAQQSVVSGAATGAATGAAAGVNSIGNPSVHYNQKLKG